MDFEKYIDKALELGSKAVSEHGAQAWETTLWIARISVIQDLLLCVFFMIAIILYWNPVRKKVVAWCEEDTEIMTPFYTVGGLASTAASIITLCILLNIWTWIGLFYPELYLAKLALEKVL